MTKRGLLFCLSVLALVLCATPPLAAQTRPAKQDAAPDKPFAEHFIALQLSDSDPKKERLVLSVASNLLKAYGPDKVAVEVVTFGPGIDLLRDTNEHRALVDSLVTQGVRFSVCGNTLDTIERDTGKRPKINPHAVEVQVGVGHLLDLAERGFTIVRP
ncbi:DsrE family protein [Tardiphaga sp. 768_D3_N2_1]|uniref:DsrE family protein n=1 Tax=Tardiphaga sp. 768_D3_N2_1 TaxID=3240783 RepID=UPI003F8A1BE8